MELRQLRHLVAVVRAGSINQAAVEQHISQSALTRSIQNLEIEVEGELFTRTVRGAIPTALGRALNARALVILNEAERARTELGALRTGRKGHVNLGVGTSFADQLLTPAVASVLARNAGITFTIQEGLIEHLAPRLRIGELDFIFSLFPVYGEETDLKLEPLLEVSSPIIARREHPLAQGATRQELSAAAWIVLQQEHVRRFHEAFFIKHRLPLPAFRIQTNSITTLRGMLLRSNLVALLPAHLVAEDLESGRLVAIGSRYGPLLGRAGLAFAPHGHITGAASLLAQALRTECSRARGYLRSLAK